MSLNIVGDKQTNLKIKPQYLTFLLMIYVTFSLVGDAVLYKLVKIEFIVAPGGILSLPIVLLMEDIIAEVYGYKISRLLLWYILLSQLIFSLFVIFIIHMHSPSYWHDQAAFNTVFGSLLKGAPIMVIAIFCGRFLNLYAITKLKIWARGKYFWLRSICACLLGDLVTLTILYTIVFHALPFQEMAHLYLSDLFVRVSYSIVGGGFGVFIVRYLKKHEGIDVYDYATNFNPFKLSLDD